VIVSITAPTIQLAPSSQCYCLLGKKENAVDTVVKSANTQQPVSFPFASGIQRITDKWQLKSCAFSALTLLVGRQEGHPACKKTDWWGAGMVICLEKGADLHMAQLMPLPVTVSRFNKIQIGFTFLVPAPHG